MKGSIRFIATIALLGCTRPQSAAESLPCTSSTLAANDSVAPAQPLSDHDSATRAELISARDAVWRAYYQGDTTTLGRLLPEPMFGMGQSRANIIASAAAFGQGRTLHGITFMCDEFYVSGDVAVVLSNYRVDHEHGGTRAVDAGRAIEVFERRDGRWINPYWHLDPR